MYVPPPPFLLVSPGFSMHTIPDTKQTGPSASTMLIANAMLTWIEKSSPRNFSRRFRPVLARLLLCRARGARLS